MKGLLFILLVPSLTFAQPPAGSLHHSGSPGGGLPVIPIIPSGPIPLPWAAPRIIEIPVSQLIPSVESIPATPPQVTIQNQAHYGAAANSLFREAMNNIATNHATNPAFTNVARPNPRARLAVIRTHQTTVETRRQLGNALDTCANSLISTRWGCLPALRLDPSSCSSLEQDIRDCANAVGNLARAIRNYNQALEDEQRAQETGPSVTTQRP